MIKPSRVLKKLRLGLLGLFLGLSLGGAGCPATPPTGPAELPSPVSLRFPRSLTIDVSKISSGEGSALKVVRKGFIGSSGEFSREISFGADMASIVNHTAEVVVSEDGILGDIEVAIDPAVTTFTTTAFFEGREGELKIDFARFSSTREETQNCSGSTSGEIVCYRIWAEGKRFIAGFFTEIPTETHDGTGHLWVDLSEIPSELLPAEAAENAPFGMTWDHTDPSDKTTEMFIDGEVAEGTVLDRAHYLLRRQGEEEATSTKTLKLTEGLSGRDTGEIRYVGRWEEASDFWSGNIDYDTSFSTKEDPDVCARISTGEGVDDSNCASIDTVGEEFLDFAAEEDFALPSDFPSSPTF